MDIYSALAEPTRRKIIELLALRGQLSATDISGNFKISPPAISQHLKVLREAKLVDMEKRAQSRIYTINTNKLHEIEVWIGKINKSWEQRFDRLDCILKEMENNNGVTIERVFDAPVEMVWKAWTDEELAKKWWGPEGFSAPSIKMDLRVGGMYIFAMHGPAGSEWDKDIYSAGIYKEIVPNEKLVVTDYFSDEAGNKIKPSKEGMDQNFPDEMTVTVLFEKIEDNKAKLTIIYPHPETEEQYQAMLKSGMKEGWNSSLNKFALALEK